MIWNSPIGTLRIERWPYPGLSSHQGWDAADDWILEHLLETDEHLPDSDNVRVIGEDFGALSCSFAAHNQMAPHGWSPSLLANRAREHNLNLNGFGSPEDNAWPRHKHRHTDELAEAHCDPSRQQHIFIRLPRSLGALAQFLEHARGHCLPGGSIYVGGSDRRWNSGASQLLQTVLGAGHFGRFRKRARWAVFPADNLAETEQSVVGILAGGGIGQQSESHRELNSHTIGFSYNKREYRQVQGCYSADHLDPGAAFLLEHLDELLAHLPSEGRIADLGCGNGILGIETHIATPSLSIDFFDESRWAIESCRGNWQRLCASDEARFYWNDGLEACQTHSLHGVLCNPPFHYANIQTDQIARRMFQQSSDCLKPGMSLFVVGNSHLGYHRVLRQYFGKSYCVARSKRFVLLRAWTETI